MRNGANDNSSLTTFINENTSKDEIKTTCLMFDKQLRVKF